MTKKYIYVVTGSTGEYSDQIEWMVCAFSDKEQAEKYVLMLDSKLRELKFSVLNAGDGSLLNRHTERGKDAIEVMRQIDPGFYTDYTGTRYYLIPVELRGQDDK